MPVFRRCFSWYDASAAPEILRTVVAVSLIVEAVMDILTYIFGKK